MRVKTIHFALLLAVIGGHFLLAQEPAANTDSASSTAAVSGQRLPVNWVYGAYIPKEASLETLTAKDRVRLWSRQGFTTPGIWVKTGLFTLSDQGRDSPPGWPQNAEGFGQRMGMRYAQLLMQNSFTALGDSLAGSQATTYAATASASASVSNMQSFGTS